MPMCFFFFSTKLSDQCILLYNIENDANATANELNDFFFPLKYSRAGEYW